MVSARAGQAIDEADLAAFVRHAAGGIQDAPAGASIVVDTVRRAANGKADYKWAKDVALAGRVL